MSDQPQSIKDFCTRIEEDAAKEIAGILDRAEYTAKARAAQFLQEAQDQKEAILGKAAEDAKTARRLVLSDLNLELKKVGLRIKGEIVEETMSLLRQRLAELRSSQEYVDFLIGLAIEGINVLGVPEIVLHLGEKDASLFTQDLVDAVQKRAKELSGKDTRVSIARETIKGSSGLRVESKDGRLLYDNTIESRIERLGDNLRLLISRKIFG